MQVYDCILYDGEVDLLELRLEELRDVVDVFVIVEATWTRGRSPKRKLFLREQWSRVRAFADRIRYVVVADRPASRIPRDREALLRMFIHRGLRDAQPDDLILLSDADEIPRASAVLAAKGSPPSLIGFELNLFSLALNYRNVRGPATQNIRTVGFPHSALAERSPQDLRSGIMSGLVAARRLPAAGWHFSYLADPPEIQRRLENYFRQMIGKASILRKRGPDSIIRRREDLFRRPGFVWDVVTTDDLPQSIRDDPARFSRFIVDPNGRFGGGQSRSRLLGKLHPFGLSPAAAPNRERGATPRMYPEDPVILIPYLRDADAEAVREAFDLDGPGGQHLPVFLWQDVERIGPERAFQYCWSQFPDRDVIILHTDMRPMPHDQTNEWYRSLISHARRLPDAAIVACDLLFPVKAPSGNWYVQAGGGFFREGGIGWIGAGVDRATLVASPSAVEYDERFRTVRSVDWATFGGLLIRREIIDMVGKIDEAYEWAYVMDVDFCMRIHLCGRPIWQVPVNLLHRENGTTEEFLADPIYRSKMDANFRRFYEKWKGFLRRYPNGLNSGSGGEVEKRLLRPRWFEKEQSGRR